MVFKQTNHPRLFLLLIFLFYLSSCKPIPPEDVNEMQWPTDQWEVTDPELVGMDPDLVEDMLVEIDTSGLNLDGVVIVHRGVIVAERYYPVYSQQTLHESYSITKSVVSALVGIALKEGCINSLDDPILDYFPDLDLKNPDEAKKTITIKHLLTMSSGLSWDQDEMVSHLDWIQYSLDQPLIHQPGTTWLYSNGGPHILSALIQSACKMDTQEFADKHLFGPLGISDYRWQRAIDGHPKRRLGLGYDSAGFGKVWLFIPEGWGVGRSANPASGLG